MRLFHVLPIQPKQRREELDGWLQRWWWWWEAAWRQHILGEVMRHFTNENQLEVASRVEKFVVAVFSTTIDVGLAGWLLLHSQPLGKNYQIFYMISFMDSSSNRKIASVQASVDDNNFQCVQVRISIYLLRPSTLMFFADAVWARQSERARENRHHHHSRSIYRSLSALCARCWEEGRNRVWKGKSLETNGKKFSLFIAPLNEHNAGLWKVQLMMANHHFSSWRWAAVIPDIMIRVQLSPITIFSLLSVLFSIEWKFHFSSSSAVCRLIFSAIFIHNPMHCWAP